jgi:hypothetical protein
MPRIDLETAIATIEVQQLIVDWGYDLDAHGGLGVPALCTEDCEYYVGGMLHQGREAVRRMYEARNERVRTQQKDGVRTQRHTIGNFRIRLVDADSATAEFGLVNYSGEGRAPVLDLQGPTIVADCRMNFRRGPDGGWLIALFDSTPVFIGNDPFLNASVVKR